MTPADPARIHLLPAKASPYVLVLRRKPSKCFHVIRWNTRSDALEHGSWFHGRLYPKRCDISFDGQWMVYLAMGASGETWNGISRVPYLHAVAEGPNTGTWFGGGYWRDPATLLLNHWRPAGEAVPFEIAPLDAASDSGDLGVLYARWRRDGWRRLGEEEGTARAAGDAPRESIERVGDGWRHKPSHRHPALIARCLGCLEHGYTFRFVLDGYADLLDASVDSACWDSLGNLVYAREGRLYKYTLDDLEHNRPASVHDLEPLAWRADR